jgi:glycosyltransferase involved in cell wall biosynthesis
MAVIEPPRSAVAADRMPGGAGPGVPGRCLWLTKGLGRGGVERLLVDMFPLVDGDRYHVDIAYVLPWKDVYHRALEDQGARVVCLGSRGRGDVRWIPRLRRLLIEGRYDLVHTHAPLVASAARTVPLPGRRPVVVHTEHNLWERYRFPTRALNAVTYHRNRAVIAVSDVVAASIRPRPSRRRPPVDTIHHGTVLDSVRSWDREDRRRRRRAVGLPEDGFVVGTVGNFTAKKDHANLLAALAGPGPIQGATLALVGLGPLEAQLRRQAEEAGMAGRTLFLGSRDDVFDLLPLFDVFCLSSRFEGFPIALVEAMASGLPCVATTVGGIPEIVEDGRNGALVAPGDPEALRYRIEQLMEDPGLAARFGTAAKASAQGLDLRQAVGRMQDLYDRALDRVRG